MPVKGVEGKSEGKLQRPEERRGGCWGRDEGVVRCGKVCEDERDGSVETVESLYIPETA